VGGAACGRVYQVGHNVQRVGSEIDGVSFGIVATLLEMIPFIGLVFAFTNTVGAALWAADLEKSGGAPNDMPQEQTKVIPEVE
jgi:hypothetical protein